jgi:hypothetical protein
MIRLAFKKSLHFSVKICILTPRNILLIDPVIKGVRA